MNEIEQFLETITKYLQSLNGAPAVLLVLLSCIVWGYVLRNIKKFPNDAIPVAVILFAPVVGVWMADANNDMPLRVWIVRNVLVNLIIGFVAWLLHNKLLSKLETKLGLFKTEKNEPPKP